MDLQNFSNIFHWGYVVANMDRALKTWIAQGSELIVPPAADPVQRVTCCFLIYKGTVPIELVAPLDGGPSPVETRLKKGGGLDHVCLFTDNLEAEVATLRANGGQVVVEPCYGSVFDRRLAFVSTRMGLLVEIMNELPEGQLSIDPLRDRVAFRS